MNITHILEQHKLWLESKKGARAELTRVNLRRANLAGANLAGAKLHRANLHGANLHGANLYGANLYGANLYGANLTGANLTGANLAGANLHRANLYGAIMTPSHTLTGHYHHIQNIGSEQGTLELYKCTIGWYVKRCCFEGDLQTFINAVKTTHGDNIHAKKYLALVEVLCDE